MICKVDLLNNSKSFCSSNFNLNWMKYQNILHHTALSHFHSCQLIFSPVSTQHPELPYFRNFLQILCSTLFTTLQRANERTNKKMMEINPHHENPARKKKVLSFRYSTRKWSYHVSMERFLPDIAMGKLWLGLISKQKKYLYYVSCLFFRSLIK
jgi:hypothetical protein